MDLKELFENSVLNEETQQVVEEAFNQAVEAKTAEVKADYETKLVEKETEIKEANVDVINEIISEELEKIGEELEEARTLEIRYADKLEQFKEEWSQQKEEEMRVQIAEAVAEEMQELKEDVEKAKEAEFAIALTERFRDVYEEMFGGSDRDTMSELKEAKEELDSLKRENKINELLESVTGRKREIAKTILESVPTERLETKFESVKQVLLAETNADDKDGEVVEEGNTGSTEKPVEGKVVVEGEEDETGNVQVNTDFAKQLERSLKFARS